ncbi:unnamed protein product [Ilex paraguariensis]|uniref:NAD(P)-binding domain-containing protein n=1 Tax=Ilex paraguariensis TaxID=185542 RepID=A0ABC8SJS8_9AQUA
MTSATAALTPTTTALFGGAQTRGSRHSPEFMRRTFPLSCPTTATSDSCAHGWSIAAHRAHRRSTLLVFSRAASSASAPETGKDKKKQKKKDNYDDEEEEEDNVDGVGNPKKEQPSSSSSSVSVMRRLDDVNPVGLGRRSRQIFDEVWRKFSGLGQISRTTRTDDEASLLIREGGPMCEFAIPGAQNTTVLVVGATSRVGRIVVRKLMLRGYTVKVPLLASSHLSHLI